MTKKQANKAFLEILHEVSERFPQCRAQLEPVPDSDVLRGIAVYGVPKSQRQAVKHYVSDLGLKRFYRTGYGLLTFVVDEASTQKYYPGIAETDNPCRSAFVSGETYGDWDQSLRVDVKSSDPELEMAA